MITFLVFFGYSFVSFTDPDYWWHFRTGQLIVQELAIPHHDPFSFTITGHRWIADSWLSEVFIYLSVSHLGYPFTLGCFSLISIASFSLMRRRLIRLGTPPLIAVALVFLAMAMSATYWTVRPQLLTWCLLAVCIDALHERHDPPWLLVPMMALWANLHPGFGFGLVVVCLWYGVRLWERQSDHTAFDWRSGALFVAACWLATFANPNGPLLLLHRLAFLPFLGGAEDLKAISEWASPNFHDTIHLPLLLGIILLISVALGGQVRDRFAVLLAVTFTVFALSSSRYQPMFAIAYLPAAGLGLRDLRIPDPFARSTTRPVANWAISGVTALLIIAAIPLLPKAQIDRQARVDSWIYYPSDALAWVQSNEPNANLFTEYQWGGFFLNTLYPHGHVFIDGRSDTYGHAVIDEYFSIMNANYHWQQMLEGSGANVVVVSRDRRLAAALAETRDWRLVRESQHEMIFVRERS